LTQTSSVRSNSKMADKDELYFSITQDKYRENKSALLSSQADLLKALKHLHGLRVLARQKADLKVRLHKLFESALKNTEILQGKMPTPKVPKSVHKEEPKEEEPEVFSSVKRDDIEDELRAIQEKLRELNG